MYKINFYLKGVTRNSDKASKAAQRVEKPFPIIISIVSDNRRWIISTKRKILPSKWSKDDQNLKLSVNSTMAEKGDRAWISMTKSTLESLNGQNNPLMTKAELLKLIHGTVIDTRNKNLKDSFEAFLIRHSTNEGHPLRANTVKKYKTLLNHLIEYQKGDSFSIKRFDKEYAESFRQFLLKERQLSDNSVAKYIKSLKTFLLEYSTHHKVGLGIDLDKIKATERPAPIHILNRTEVVQLKDHQLHSRELQQVRDIFLFQCFTGQRYSDIQNITWNQISEDESGGKFWSVNVEKTNCKVTVPLSNHAADILLKYRELPSPLPKLSNQHMNRELKNLAKIAGLNRKLELFIFRNGVKKIFYKPLHDVISTHMGRKTFISLSLQMNIPERAVREISGHKDEKSFSRYIELNGYYHQSVRDLWDASICSVHDQK